MVTLHLHKYHHSRHRNLWCVLDFLCYWFKTDPLFNYCTLLYFHSRRLIGWCFGLEAQHANLISSLLSFSLLFLFLLPFGFPSSFALFGHCRQIQYALSQLNCLWIDQLWQLYPFQYSICINTKGLGILTQGLNCQ